MPQKPCKIWVLEMFEALFTNPDVVVALVGARWGRLVFGRHVSGFTRQLASFRRHQSFGAARHRAGLPWHRQPVLAFFVAGAAAVGLLTVFLTELLMYSQRVKADAATGLVYPFLFAIAGVLISVFARGVHIGTDAVLLGKIGLVKSDFRGSIP